MLVVDDIPAYWRLVLQRVQDYDKSAQISGGALRDLYCGKQPKDLDIVVGFDTNMSDLKGALGATIKTYDDKGADYVASQNRFVETFIAEGLKKDIPINVVRLAEGRDPAEEYKHHDFGAVQITFDGASIRATAQFNLDMENTEFTLTRADDNVQFRRSIGRYMRWMGRYPGWKLVLPPGAATAGFDPNYVTVPKADLIEIMAAYDALINGFEDHQPRELIAAAKAVNLLLKKSR